MTRLVTLVILIIGGAVLGAQQPPAASAAFAVASVKPSQVDTLTSRPGAFLPEGFVAQNATLRILIHRAYPEFTDRPGRIVGPDWIDNARYDVEGKAGNDATRSDLIAMLRGLLAERFGLRVHTETRSENGFALVPARTDGRFGPGLRRSQGQCTTLSIVPPATERAELPPCAYHQGFASGLRTVSFRGAPIDRVVTMLQNANAKSVVDRTNLSGTFDVDLEWAAEDALLASQEPAAGPGIVTAVQEQLGLKLESMRMPLEVLVIDAVQRPEAN